MGIVCFKKFLFSFLVSIKYFKAIYPTFLNINLWDFLNYFLTEFLALIIIGYLRRETENSRAANKITKIDGDKDQILLEDAINQNKVLYIQ